MTIIPTAINNLFHWGHGLSTFAIRFVTAAFGVGTVWLILCLRRYLGGLPIFERTDFEKRES